MSTHADIWMKTADGYRGVHLHYDGYISHAYRILVGHYQDAVKVQQLIDYGDISSLDTMIETCVFYHRDKEENYQDVCARHVTSLEEILKYANEYVYLYDVETGWQILSGQTYE